MLPAADIASSICRSLSLSRRLMKFTEATAIPFLDREIHHFY